VLILGFLGILEKTLKIQILDSQPQQTRSSATTKSTARPIHRA